MEQQANNIYHQMNGIMKDKESSTDRDKSNKQSKRKIFGNKSRQNEEKEEIQGAKITRIRRDLIELRIK